MVSTSTTLNTDSNKNLKLLRHSILLLLVLLPAILFSSCKKQNTATKTASSTPKGPIGPPGYPPAVMNTPYPGTGVIVTINRDEGWIEINHEEIKNLMPAMQMEFNVKDKSLLDQVKVGQRVDFTIVETTDEEYLADIKPKP